MKLFIVAFLFFLITSERKYTLANEQQGSILLNWKKETESSFWTAEVNRFDVPSGVVVEVKGPKDGLIRVTGDQPTSIKGTLISSKPIYVMNPNGVVLDAKASIEDNQKNPSISRRAAKIKPSTDKENEKRKKDMEKTWMMAYDFVPGPGIDPPFGIVQTGSITVPFESKWLSEFIWLGDIRIGGISGENEGSGSPRNQEELMREEMERVKIKRSTSPLESLDGGWSGSIEMLEVEGSGPGDIMHIPKRAGNRVTVPKIEKH